MATKIALKMEHNLKVVKNPSGLGWVIQDVTSHGLLTRHRPPATGLYLSWYAKYDAKRAKEEDGWCNNGSLWPSQEAAQSFLDQILGATQAVEEASQMATRTLAWAVGYGGTEKRPFKDFMIRRSGPSDGWTDDDWVAEGRYQDPLTKMPVVLMYQSGPTIEYLATAIREKYERENIWVDNRPEVPTIFQVARVDELPKNAEPGPVIYTPRRDRPMLASMFVPGDYAVFDVGGPHTPKLVKIKAVEFEAPKIAGRTAMEVHYTFYEGELKARYHSDLFHSVEAWKLKRDQETQKTYVALKETLEASIAEEAALSPVVSKSDKVKFYIYRSEKTRMNTDKGAKTFVAFQASHGEWSFTADATLDLIQQIKVQYPNATIEVKS